MISSVTERRAYLIFEQFTSAKLIRHYTCEARVFEQVATLEDPAGPNELREESCRPARVGISKSSDQSMII